MSALYSRTPVTEFVVMVAVAFHVPPDSENSTRSMPLTWNATTPTGNVDVMVWFGTTSQRAIAVWVAAAPVPICENGPVGPSKPAPAGRSGISAEGAGGGGGTGVGAGVGAGAGSCARCG